VSSDTRLKERSGKTKYILLLAAVLAVTGGWSGAWVFGRSVLSDQLHGQLAALAGQGTDVRCNDLAIGGFPFRYEVQCSGLKTAGQSGTEGTLSRLKAVALVYNPWHVILEAETPVAVSIPVAGVTGQLTWDTARASAKYSTDKLGDVDIVLTQPELSVKNAVGSGQARSDKAEAHLRPSPDMPGAVDGFVSVNGLVSDGLPPLPGPIDARVHVRALNGDPLLSGAALPDVILQNGGALPLRLELAELVLGSSRIGAEGDVTLNTSGSLSGNLTLTLVGPEGVLDALRPLFPPNSNQFSVLQSLLTRLQPTGKDRHGNPAIEFPLILDNGLMRIGFLTLGRIPPLFPAGS